MERLLKGIARFQKEVFPRQKQLFEQLATGQKPRALFITCADSRVVPQLITQSDPGELFICRNAGNMVPPYGEVHGGVSATIEYAVWALGVKHIVVCGHSDCGAMKGILHPEAVADMPTVASWLRHGDVARRVVRELHPGKPDEELLPRLTEENIAAQLQNLRTHPSVAGGLARGTLEIHGWLYHINSGRVDGWDPQTRRFSPLLAQQPAGAPELVGA